MTIRKLTRQYGLLLLLPTLVLGQTGTGLKGDYFNNTSLSSPVALTRTDAAVNFEWGYNIPAAGIPADKFSIRWSGQVEAPITSEYTFATVADDGVRLWVDGKLLVNHWNDHSSARDEKKISLVAGRKYDIQLDYYENIGSAKVQLRWSYPGQADQIIPQNRLSPTPIVIQAIAASTATSTDNKVYLSDLPFISQSNGWGLLERDRSNGELGPSDGHTIKLAGTSYSKGLGVHADSIVRVALDDRYDMFKAVIGIDDEVGQYGSVIFEVWLDGVRKFQSPLMNGNTPSMNVSVPTENAKELKLVVTTGGDGAGNDHADWADARFEGVETIKYLSDLKWVSATNGRGEVQLDRPMPLFSGGITLGRFFLRGQSYTKGLGTLPAAEVKYNLDKKYERFSAVLGIDDVAVGFGSAIFEVWSGGTKLYRSDMLRGSSAAQHISIDVRDKSDLILKVLDGGDGNSFDIADWADAKLLPIGSDAPAVPNAPTNLTAMPGNTLVNLSWQAVSGATSYNLYRGTSAGGQSSTPIATNIAATTYSNTGLTNGTLYLYKVKAVNAAGIGNASNEASATPVAATTPTPLPGAPSNLTATPGNTLVNLSWQAVSGATSYNLYRGTTSGGQASAPVAMNITATTYSNTGLTNGTAYFFKVKAVNATGPGNFSNEASATPVAPVTPTPVPGAPSNLTATAGNALVNLAWQAVSGATSYNVYRGTAAGGQSTTPVATNVNGTTYSNTGLTNGTTYFFKVSAVNATGTGNPSNEASAKPEAPVVQPPVPGVPTNLTATPGDKLVNLAWQAVSGATSYNVYRGTAAGGQAAAPIATNLTAPAYSNTGLTNGTTYFYKVRAVNATGTGNPSNEASAKPVAPPPTAPTTAPTNLTATPGSAEVSLAWQAVSGATSYNVYRGTATNAQSTTPIATNVTGTTYKNTGLTNGTTYFYKLAAVNSGGTGPSSSEASATPAGRPVAPVISAVPGDGKVTLSWAPVSGATSYNLFRGTTPNGQGGTPVATGIPASPYDNTGLTNGTGYFYRMTAVGPGGESQRSEEVTGTPSAPAQPADPATLSAFRLVRQTSFGPKPGEVDRVKTMGRTAYLDEQFNLAPSVYPDTLYDQSIEDVQEHFFRLALTGNDQLRQRVAFALSKIWSVNAAEVNRSDATVVFYRIFMNRAFGNYRDLMTDITLNPNMGRFLNMLNSKSEAFSKAPAVENFPRELMQLFTLGGTLMNVDGTEAAATPPYAQDDIKALARLFTGWTFGDGNATSIPNNSANENWRVPMEAVERFHDITAKTFLSTSFAPNRTTKQDLDQALDVIFNHPNMPPFVAKSLIKQLVTSNPSPAYVAAVANAFINNGNGVRGDMRAVLRAIFTHSEANLGTPTSGKLMEPVLLVVSPMRTMNATISDYPFMSDLAEEMGQKVLYPPSVFSYFSPFFQIRNGALLGPEFQLLTSVTALTRTNFIARVLNNDTGGSVAIDYTPFANKAADASVLVDYVALQFMGGQISTEQRAAMITAVNVTPATDPTERAKTAIYLVCTAAQYQVDR